MIALDVLAVQASSVPCKWLFSAGKQVVTDRHAHLGSDRFEEILMMKFVWKDAIHNFASWNIGEVTNVDMQEYEELLHENVDAAEWDKDTGFALHSQ